MFPAQFIAESVSTNKMKTLISILILLLLTNSSFGQHKIEIESRFSRIDSNSISISLYNNLDTLILMQNDWLETKEIKKERLAKFDKINIRYFTEKEMISEFDITFQPRTDLVKIKIEIEEKKNILGKNKIKNITVDYISNKHLGNIVIKPVSNLVNADSLDIIYFQIVNNSNEKYRYYDFGRGQLFYESYGQMVQKVDPIHKSDRKIFLNVNSIDIIPCSNIDSFDSNNKCISDVTPFTFIVPITINQSKHQIKAGNSINYFIQEVNLVTYEQK